MSTATYKINNEHNGIEIYFDSMPDKETLNKLHEKKWRDRKSTRLNSSHRSQSRMPSSA